MTTLALIMATVAALFIWREVIRQFRASRRHRATLAQMRLENHQPYDLSRN